MRGTREDGVQKAVTVFYVKHELDEMIAKYGVGKQQLADGANP